MQEKMTEEKIYKIGGKSPAIIAILSLLNQHPRDRSVKQSKHGMVILHKLGNPCVTISRINYFLLHRLDPGGISDMLLRDPCNFVGIKIAFSKVLKVCINLRSMTYGSCRFPQYECIADRPLACVFSIARDLRG